MVQQIGLTAHDHSYEFLVIHIALRIFLVR